jgi:hypothetical protein
LIDPTPEEAERYQAAIDFWSIPMVRLKTLHLSPAWCHHCGVLVAAINDPRRTISNLVLTRLIDPAPMLRNWLLAGLQVAGLADEVRFSAQAIVMCDILNLPHVCDMSRAELEEAMRVDLEEVAYGPA